MLVYLVYGNDYVQGYGQNINTYGIFTSKEEAMKTRERILKSIVDRCTDEYDCPDEAWVEVQGIITDMDCEIYLGGYCE